MAKEDTWESRENLENAKELVEEFEKEYGEETEEVWQQKKKREQKGILKRTTREIYSKNTIGMV